MFGLGGVFLTVTPDDENSFLVTAYSQVDNQGNAINIDNLTDYELRQRAKKREETRIKFPGITALNFERIVDIVLDEVVGWDRKNNCARSEPGLFGIPLAYGGAIEEQGRMTLHIHLIVWLEGWDIHSENVVSPHTVRRNEARRQICWVIDNCSTTELVQFNP